MPDIYTNEWYDAVREAMNASAATLNGVPTGSFVVAVEIVGDGLSPYVEQGSTRHFLVKIDAGRCEWYREIASSEDERRAAGRGVDYRFTGSATAFDEIACGVLDPIDAALRGTVRVRGDMRFLMRHAEHVNALLGAYSREVDTTWPSGMPPYGVPSAAGAASDVVGTDAMMRRDGESIGA